MSDWPSNLERRSDDPPRSPRYAGLLGRRNRRRTLHAFLYALAITGLFLIASSAFAAVSDDGYAYDSDCGDQGDACPYSSAYHLRIGSGDTWTYLGSFGPAGSVMCPYTRTPGDKCYYLVGTAPAGAAQGTGGGVEWANAPFPPEDPSSGPVSTAVLTDNDSLNALTIGLLFVIGGLGFIGGRLR